MSKSKQKKKFIDDKERKIEENIINNYMIIVDNFIKSRKKKISL